MDGIIQSTRGTPENEDEIFDIEKKILHHEKPQIWNIHRQNNMERMLEVDFQKFAVSVTELTGADLGKVSTFTFYASVEHLKEKFKDTKNVR